MPHWKLFLTQLGELLTDHPDSETVQDSAMNQRKEEIDINFECGLNKYFFKFWPKIDYLRVSFPCLMAKYTTSPTGKWLLLLPRLKIIE